MVRGTIALPFPIPGFVDACAPIESYEVSLQTPNTSAAWEARVRRRQWNGEGVSSRQDLASSVMSIGTDPSLGDEPIAWIEATGTIRTLQSSPTFTSATLDIPGAGRYRARVCAVNVVRQRTCAYSDGFVADYTPPSKPTVCAVVANKEPTCSPVVLPVRDRLALAWHGCVDAESGVGKFVWSVSNAAAGGDVLKAEENVRLQSRVDLDAPAITHAGALEVYIHVSCFNGAGVASNANLGPLSFDDTPPSFEANALSTVGLRAHQGIDYSSNSVVRLRVGVAMDLESGLRSLVLRVHARGSSRSCGRNCPSSLLWLTGLPPPWLAWPRQLGFARPLSGSPKPGTSTSSRSIWWRMRADRRFMTSTPRRRPSRTLTGRPRCRPLTGPGCAA